MLATRTTRMAKNLPGTFMTVEVTGRMPLAVGELPNGRRAAMTTDETRTELLEALAELGRAHPNRRLGQTLSNLAMAAGHLEAGAVWDLEEEEALATARLILMRRAEASSAKT